MLTILSFRALHITRALSCEAWSDRPRPAQHLLISIKLPLLVIQATFIDIHKKTRQCDNLKLFRHKFGFYEIWNWLFQPTILQMDLFWSVSRVILQNPTQKCVRKLYLLNTSTFITKVLSYLPSQADGHDLVIAPFVRVPESTQTDSRAERRIFFCNCKFSFATKRWNSITNVFKLYKTLLGRGIFEVIWEPYLFTFTWPSCHQPPQIPPAK